MEEELMEVGSTQNIFLIISMNNETEDIPILALLCGYIATLCFTIQYVPQLYLNHKRKSVKGFSSTGILIKLIGASFLAANSYLVGEASPVVIYGMLYVLNVTQHVLFMFQFLMFSKDKKFMVFMLIPLVPLVLGIVAPDTMNVTALIKPLSQILSHFPQLYVTYQKKSSEGVSLLTQHLNVIGGIAGLIMVQRIEAKSSGTIMMYINSLFQALSLYAFTWYYDGIGKIYESIPFVGYKREKRENSDLILAE